MLNSLKETSSCVKTVYFSTIYGFVFLWPLKTLRNRYSPVCYPISDKNGNYSFKTKIIVTQKSLPPLSKISRF